MPYLDGIIPVALAFFVVTVSPGPANIATAMVAMRRGRGDGFVFGLGLSLGLAFWGLIAATGMGALLQGSAVLLSALKILGGLYLLWLALSAWRAAENAGPEALGTPRDGRWFLRGLMLNLSNPKAVFAWMAALSMGMGSHSDAGFITLVTLICVALGFLNYALWAAAFSLPGFMAGYRRFQRWIDRIVAGLFAMAGASLIRSALDR